MQKQGSALWLLMGMIWLLAGCVAPDGSVIQFEQAQDGSIVGWQVDVPAVEHSTPYLPPPILYMDFAAGGTIQAVDRDGTSLGIVGAGWLSNVSHQGDRFAYLTSGTNPNTTALIVLTREGGAQTFFDALPGKPDGGLFGQLSWSPDSTQIAFVLHSRGDRHVVLVDVASRQIVNEFSLPPNLFALFHTIWSPDGQKLLLVGVPVFLLDLNSGKVELILEEGLWLVGGYVPTHEIQWLPGSDGVVYLNRDYTGKDTWDPPILWHKYLGEKPEQLLTADQLASLGLDVTNPLFIRLSPTGTYLALTNMGHGSEVGASLLVLDFALVQSGSIEKRIVQPPVAHWELPGMITSLEWSPDEQDLAFLMLSYDGDSYLGSSIKVLSISDGTSRSLAELELTEEQFWATWNSDMVSWMP